MICVLAVFTSKARAKMVINVNFTMEVANLNQTKMTPVQMARDQLNKYLLMMTVNQLINQLPYYRKI